MRIGELARRAAVTTKAVRYYEQIGLLNPRRTANTYRSYDDDDLRIVVEIRALSEMGIPPSRCKPFVECLESGHEHSDECASSLSAYRDAIADLDVTIDALSKRRAALQQRLFRGASNSFPDLGVHASDRSSASREAPPMDYTTLPEGLPVPDDDGGAEHLPGLDLPGLELPTSDGHRVQIDRFGRGRTILYLYPLTGRPGVDLPDGWDAIPGARGCSTEACDFRDHFDDLRAAGIARVYGLSSQEPEYQDEVVRRLRLPFPMISDELLELADALDLPTFEAPGQPRLFSRLTLVVADNQIEHVFYPIFPPNTHAQSVLTWLEAHPRTESR